MRQRLLLSLRPRHTRAFTSSPSSLAKPSPSTSVLSTAVARIQTSPLGRALSWYGDKQKKRPYWTQFFSTVVIFLFSDLSAQLLVPWVTQDNNNDSQDDAETQEEKLGILDRYDPLRTLRHVSIGGFVAIPSYTWFMFVHNNFNYASKFLSITTKVVLSQVIYAPLFNVYFFSAQSLLSGASWSETLQRLQVTLPVSIVNSAKIWPAVSAFMFLYIDPAFRAIFAGVIALGWQTYLSWLNQIAAREVRAREKQKEVGAGPVGKVAV